MPIVRLYVKNLEFSVTEDELEAEFEVVGRPTICNVIRDYNTGKSRGFGFVTLDTMNKPMDCWREPLQGKKLKGRKMHIDYAIPKGQADQIKRQKPPSLEKRTLVIKRGKRVE